MCLCVLWGVGRDRKRKRERKKEKEREKESETKRQRQRQTDRQIDRQTDRQRQNDFVWDLLLNTTQTAMFQVSDIVCSRFPPHDGSVPQYKRS